MVQDSEVTRGVNRASLTLSEDNNACDFFNADYWLVQKNYATAMAISNPSNLDEFNQDIFNLVVDQENGNDLTKVHFLQV